MGLGHKQGSVERRPNSDARNCFHQSPQLNFFILKVGCPLILSLTTKLSIIKGLCRSTLVRFLLLVNDDFFFTIFFFILKAGCSRMLSLTIKLCTIKRLCWSTLKTDSSYKWTMNFAKKTTIQTRPGFSRCSRLISRTSVLPSRTSMTLRDATGSNFTIKAHFGLSEGVKPDKKSHLTELSSITAL